MNRTMRIATSAWVAMMVFAAGLAIPVAGSAPRVGTNAHSYDMNDFFPMAIGNTWEWADAGRAGDMKRLSIVDKMAIGGYVVWVAETQEFVQGISQMPGVMDFVAHEDGLFATRFLDSLMDWSHDTDDTAMLQRWTQREVRIGTHRFNSGGTAQAYTMDVEDGVPAIRIHDVSGEITYQRYAYGIGPVLRGSRFALQRATVGGVEYVL